VHQNIKTISEKTYTDRFLSGYVFTDPKTGFELNYAAITGFDLKKSISENTGLIEEAYQEIKAIEAGEIVNKTAVIAESENRAVDHYSLRHPDQGLGASIDQWHMTQKKAEALRNEYDVIGGNGIGGSFLGPKMALVSQLSEHYNQKLKKPMFFMSNTDSDDFYNLINTFGVKKTLLINTSKSGGTAETKGNMEAFIDLLREHDVLNVGKNNIAITTPGSKFDLFAKENNFREIFYMNENTGGRTSIGSAVGMVPMAFAGLDFKQFIMGQSHMDQLTRRQDPQDNPAMILSLAFKYVLERDNLWLNPNFQKNLINLFYNSNQQEVSHYFQQLIMESLGKNYKKDGTPIRTGLTTLGGTGTGEQHAFMQQIQKGILDAIAMITKYRRRSHDFYNEKAGSMGQQLQSFAEGTSKALRSNRVDLFNITYERNDLFNLGMTVALVERFVSIFAVFLGINPYDQPGVQDGKKAADEINELKKTLTKSISQINGRISGTVEELYHFIKSSSVNIDYEKIPLIADFLGDLEANIGVLNAYPLLKDKFNISRTFDEKKRQWRYTIETVHNEMGNGKDRRN